MKGRPDHITRPAAAAALIVRHAELLPEAVQTIMHLQAEQHKVLLYLLEPAARSLGAEEEAALSTVMKMVAYCGSNHRPTAERLGLSYSGFDDMARGLEKAHWVLTF